MYKQLYLINFKISMQCHSFFARSDAYTPSFNFTKNLISQDQVGKFVIARSLAQSSGFELPPKISRYYSHLAGENLFYSLVSIFEILYLFKSI